MHSDDPPASATSHSPLSRLRQARWTATSDDEHAVWTAMLGPRRLNCVRYPRCQKILVVLQEQAELVEVESLGQNGVRVAVRQQVVQEIAAGRAGSVHADRAVEPRGVTARVLERMPRALQEQPVLWIQHPRGQRRKPEEVGVELVDPVE